MHFYGGRMRALKCEPTATETLLETTDGRHSEYAWESISANPSARSVDEA
mgnify:CR=1 FL=1